MVFGSHSIDFSNIPTFWKFDVESVLILLFDALQLSAVPQLALCFVVLTASILAALALWLPFLPPFLPHLSNRHSRPGKSRWSGSWLINDSLTIPIGVLLDFNLHWLPFTGFGKSGQIYMELELWNCVMWHGNHWPHMAIYI